MQRWIEEMDSPPRLLYGMFLILLITYSPSLPTEYRTVADSMLGRILGLAAVFSVLQTMGWIYGLLTALAFLMILHHAPRQEGFEGTLSDKKAKGTRWFVEKVLGEHPTIISTDQVITHAIHD